jgi:predicted nucleotidyltransferase
MGHGSVERQFTAALDGVIEQIKPDRSILAAVLCGSLSHDAVWAKSDIDLVLVTADGAKAADEDKALYAEGVNIHALLFPRAEFRKIVEGALRHSFAHSFLAKGRLLYSHDPSIADLCESLSRIGERDTALQVLQSATQALPPLYKARKWFVTRGDLDYTALWILYAATPLARVEVIGRRVLADREVIPQAIRLNPSFFNAIYTTLLNTKKTRKGVETALETAEAYVDTRAATLFAPLIEYLRDARDVRSTSEIEDHFRRTHGVQGAAVACEYLADQGLLGKASAPARLTRRSNVDVQELAFFSHDR